MPWPVTGIKSCANFTNSTVTIRYTNGFSNPANARVQLTPNDTVDVDWWVPWVDEAGEFATKHIKLEVPASGKTYWIYQHGDDWNGDYVRYVTDGVWSRSATPVPGVSGTGGNRLIEIYPNGFRIERSG